MTSQTDEGIGSILTTKIADIAKSFILKPRPLVIMYSPTKEIMVSLKIKRGLLRHSLIEVIDGSDTTVATDSSAIKLIEIVRIKAEKLRRQGYIEV